MIVNKNGKIMTAHLIEPSIAEGRSAPPTTTTEYTTVQLLRETLADVMGVEQVAADSNFFDELGADSMVMARFCARLRKQTALPPVSIKTVYEHPTISSLATALTNGAPTTPPESTNGSTTESTTESTTVRLLRETLADVMGIKQVAVDSNFFDELGADSMVMARFCARLRKQTDLPPVSIKTVYEHPTVNRLATALTDAVPTTTTLGQNGTTNGAVNPITPTVKTDAPKTKNDAALTLVPASGALSSNGAMPILAQKAMPAPAQATTPVGTPRYVLCGALQFLVIFGYPYVLSLMTVLGYEWAMADATSFIDIYIRSVLAGGGIFLGTAIFPILLKWLLIGRWQPQQIRVWSLEYFRFWLVKTLIRLNPMVLFVGSPLYTLYLRALGAKIGKNVVILSQQVPACTDLLTIGDNSVIRKDSNFNCYRVQAGIIRIGPVTIGSDAYVGEKTVLDIETKLGDGAQLGHTSSLHAGQSITAGEHRCGSPALKQTNVDYRRVEPVEGSSLRKGLFVTFQLLNLIFLTSLPMSIGAVVIPMLAELPLFASFVNPLTWGAFLREVLIIAFVIFFGARLLGLVAVVTIPRVLNLALTPDKVYPLYGFHYWAHQTIKRISNAKYYIHLFGDSSYIVHYLRWIGYEFTGGILQTGSNFGSSVKHDNPFLVAVGRGTMVADGLSCINADYSHTSFKLSRVTIGANSFFGNHVAYPAQSKTGDNCLLATKVQVPLDGDVREGVGLLGSPSFTIPRSVQRDVELDDLTSEELARQLAAKNRHNLVTVGLFILGQWVYFAGWTLITYSVAAYYQTAGAWTFALLAPLGLIFRTLYQILLDRVSTLFRNLEPQECSIYDPRFWYHERYWKLSVIPNHVMYLNGTPFKTLAWRLLGAKIGKRVFDDGCYMTEKTLVTIGDECTFNAGSIVQAHSQEDGGFKSDRIIIGANCTVGLHSLVHYGVTMGDGAQIASDSFLMKGQEVPPHTYWAENPATEIQANHVAMLSMTPTLPFWQVTDNSVTLINARRNSEHDELRQKQMAVNGGEI